MSISPESGRLYIVPSTAVRPGGNDEADRELGSSYRCDREVRRYEVLYGWRSGVGLTCVEAMGGYPEPMF